MSGFYIDVDKAERLGIIERVKVSLNGRKIKRVIAAKSGRNGFVEYLVYPLRVDRTGEEAQSVKLRGNVKITISPRK